MINIGVFVIAAALGLVVVDFLLDHLMVRAVLVVKI